MAQKNRKKNRKSRKKNATSLADFRASQNKAEGEMRKAPVLPAFRDNLEWYLQRGMIDEVQYETAEAFRMAWEATQSGGLVSQLGKDGLGGGYRDEDFLERMAMRLKTLLNHPDLDRAGQSCLINVVGLGQAISAWSQDFFKAGRGGRPSRKALPVLQSALDLADRLWSGGKSRKRNRSIRADHPFGYPSHILPEDGVIDVRGARS